jgi:hypothetical protein
MKPVPPAGALLGLPPDPRQAKHLLNLRPSQNEHLKPLLKPLPLQKVQANDEVPVPLQSLQLREPLPAQPDAWPGAGKPDDAPLADCPDPWQAKHLDRRRPWQNVHWEPFCMPLPPQKVQMKAAVPEPLHSEQGRVWLGGAVNPGMAC